MIKTDLIPFRDDKTILKNPHKGWYYHYYDNNITKYFDFPNIDEVLEKIPGLNHLYLRFGWSYLEPEEGVYDWHLIDELMAKWAPKGIKASFRITCKETGGDDERQVFATPKWVFEKCGAKGRFVGENKKTWLPDYGDPIFLEKLENFLRKLAERYDDAPWLEFVDVGSYGSWGEGHNFFSGEEDWPKEVVRKHADLHKKYFKHTPVMINDDHVGNRFDMTEEEKRVEMAYYADAGYSLRDDSALVAVCAAEFGYDTLRRPWMYDMFWENRPIDMELEHYGNIAPEVFKSGFPYLAALERSHCTYAGWHGYPEPWMTDNHYFHDFAANRLGYWFLPESIALPEYFTRGLGSFVDMTVKNAGWGKIYSAAKCTVIFENIVSGTEYRAEAIGSDTSKFLPGQITTERLDVTVCDDWEPGEYIVRVLYTDEYKGVLTPIRLGLKGELLREDGSYAVAKTEIK